MDDGLKFDTVRIVGDDYKTYSFAFPSFPWTVHIAGMSYKTSKAPNRLVRFMQKYLLDIVWERNEED